MKWLQSLGEMKANWKLLTTKFSIGGQAVVLGGDSSLCKTLVSLKTLVKAIQYAEQGFLVELHNLEGVRTETSIVILEPIQ